MKFKHGKDYEIWRALGAFLDAMDHGERFRHLNREAMQKMMDALAAIDAVSIAIGHGEIMVTSFYRPGNTKSYHGKMQAFDLRSKDKPTSWLWSMEKLGQLMRENDDQIQFDSHKELQRTNDPNRHLHVEIDTGDINA